LKSKTFPLWLQFGFDSLFLIEARRLCFTYSIPIRYIPELQQSYYTAYTNLSYFKSFSRIINLII